MEDVQDFLALLFVKFISLTFLFHILVCIHIPSLSLFLTYFIRPLHINPEDSVLLVSLVDSVTAKEGDGIMSHHTLDINVIYISYTYVASLFICISYIF